MVQLFIAQNKCSDKYTLIDDAQRSVRYTCLDCHADVIPRLGSKRAHHFAHFSKVDCKGETSTHRYCKHFLEKHFHEIIFVSTCVQCQTTKTRQFSRESHYTQQEYPWNDFKIDVGVLCKESKQLVAALEVYHTHKTTREKSAQLCSSLDFFVDISTEELMRDPFHGTIHGTCLCHACYKEHEIQKQLRIQRQMKICVMCEAEYQCTKHHTAPKEYCSDTCFQNYLEQERIRMERLEQERLRFEQERLRFEQEQREKEQERLRFEQERRERRIQREKREQEQKRVLLQKLRAKQREHIESSTIKKNVIQERYALKQKLERMYMNHTMRYSIPTDTPTVCGADERIRYKCLRCDKYNTHALIELYRGHCSLECYSDHVVNK
jgi:hypothetical protein